MPALFEYNSSPNMAYYYLFLVTINDIEVESNDWVGAFNGDVCVGSRQWNINECINGICDVPAFGDDGDATTTSTAESTYSIGLSYVTSAGDSTITVGGGYVNADDSNASTKTDKGASTAIAISAVTALP